MGVTDFARFAGERVRTDGLSGVRTAADELRWSFHRRVRPLHRFAPDAKRVTVAGHAVTFRRETAAEWDHMRAIALERPMLEEYVRELRPDDTVWDVGGNVGSWTCFGATTGASVVTFEPVAANRRALRENLSRNGLESRVTVHEVALHDRAGEATFTLDARAAEGAGAGRGSLLSDWQSGEEIPVETDRGDAVDAPSPDVLKVDVEGAELPVLRGMGDLLSDVRVAFVEVHGVDDEAVLSLLQDRGFDLARRESGMVKAVRAADG